MSYYCFFYEKVEMKVILSSLFVLIKKGFFFLCVNMWIKDIYGMYNF